MNARETVGDIKRQRERRGRGGRGRGKWKRKRGVLIQGERKVEKGDEFQENEREGQGE